MSTAVHDLMDNETRIKPEALPEDRPAVLQLRGLRKKFGGHSVINGIDLDVREGEFFGLLGPNGAGKTTTISIVSGLLEPSEGSVDIFGDKMSRHNSKLKKKIAVVQQDLSIYPQLTCMENLLFFGGMYGLGGRKLKAKAMEALEIVGLSDRANKPRAGKLSGGQKRRLNIAAALMHDPKLLILDEPTVGVDPQSRNYIFETLQKLNRDGMTLIYTSHYMEEVEQLCGRVGIMDHGEIIECNPVPTLLDQHGQAVVRLKIQAADAARILEAEPELSDSVSLALDTEANLVTCVAPKLVQALNRINRLIGDYRIEPVNCEVLPPSLETVFLKLTGKSLRD
ncbi:ABC transporter ATP-binding protein [Cohnella lubricantis]|uniref:ABC transporter ATP-binding protein n=1 Tax=Cohnella lubricantis TaxID=2163172 RepID=A0A841T7G7_9BACL|nr:ABC transporter ATP-binding protein [Cohnella lubricantis]MBB6677463.1 ABC transporter ATP-binding protein [Cohnella lubricantis]MBP2116651.1 ABC-2 type transport system ATP-binding protein [Cohnella lubricantis]